MNKQIIKEKLKDIIIKIKDDNSVLINEDTSMINDLGFDSMMYVELVVEVEETFDILFEDEYLKSNSIDKAGDLIQYIGEKTHANE